jgi:hypothetical protein
MAWIQDAHYEWHAVHGRYAVCPLDCGAAEGLMAEAEEDDWVAEQD